MNKTWISSLIVATSIAFLSACDSSSSSGSGSQGSETLTSTGGSKARFTTKDQYLYAISGRNVQLFDLQNPSTPNPWTKVQLDWDIQTLFNYEDHLLVGAANGVYILDNTDPASPTYISEFTHARATDPVVAQADVGYVTLKRDSSVPDSEIEDQLNILDLSNMDNPQLISTTPMQGPNGLAVDGEKLFICDGIAGLKIFDNTDPTALTVLGSHPEIECDDLIANSGVLVVIDRYSLRQYDYSSLPMTLLSTIESANPES